ncbi:amidohydrolase family protein [Planctomonas psychrotolerans]|uniref:amidohydrolase family protein n=1 Tax=Planctomonas psychrotolerans TaxID=2528712 RepID=UPI001D0D3879|nr:amidohydrolase family protein [Planctomonas psychrotolerans]
MILDAHQHVWDLDRADYPWLGPGMGDLHRTVGFDELAPTLRALGVDGTVLVQAADNAADTTLMLDVAARHPEVVGVVAWAPLDRPDELPAHLDELTRSSLVVGVRTLIHEREPDWLAAPHVDRGLGILADALLPFDFVTSGPRALAELPAIGRRHPDLRIVIDHLGKPPIGGGSAERAEWRSLLTEAAANPLTVAKLSGLYSSVGDLASWTPDGIRPFVDDALEVFGAERLMYGGDWPISLLAGGYERTWRAMTGIVDTLSPTEQGAILGGTAQDFYRIPPTGARR